MAEIVTLIMPLKNAPHLTHLIKVRIITKASLMIYPNGNDICHESYYFQMKTNSAETRFCTFQIYMRPPSPERSNHSWLGSLEHGYTVNAQGFFILFDLSNVESFWHQVRSSQIARRNSFTQLMFD